MSGWISIHRKINEHWLWDDKPYSKGQAWIDLLLMANHKDNKFLLGNELEIVERGSFITSEIKLMKKWGWSKSKVRNFLNLLESEQMIEKLADTKKTTLTIVNYNDYQQVETTKEPQKNHERTTKEPRKNHERTTKGLRKDTNNNDNKENNDNNDNNKEQDYNFSDKTKSIFSLYENNGFGSITQITVDMINDLVKDYSEEWVVDAMKESIKVNVRNLKYTKGILKNWKAKGKGNFGGGLSGINNKNTEHKDFDEFGISL